MKQHVTKSDPNSLTVTETTEHAYVSSANQVGAIRKKEQRMKYREAAMLELSGIELSQICIRLDISRVRLWRWRKQPFYIKIRYELQTGYRLQSAYLHTYNRARILQKVIDLTESSDEALSLKACQVFLNLSKENR